MTWRVIAMAFLDWLGERRNGRTPIDPPATLRRIALPGKNEGGDGGRLRDGGRTARRRSWIKRLCPGSDTSETRAGLSAKKSLIAWWLLCARRLRTQGRP